MDVLRIHNKKENKLQETQISHIPYHTTKKKICTSQAQLLVLSATCKWNSWDNQERDLAMSFCIFSAVELCGVTALFSAFWKKN